MLGVGFDGGVAWNCIDSVISRQRDRIMGKRAKKKTESCPEACRAMCCRYVATKIDPPRNKIDFDEIYWFLSHENVEVFIESRKWYVLFNTPCRNLDERSRCVVYPTRPYVCRDHREENCEYWGEEEGRVTLRSPEDLKNHMKRRGLRLRMAWEDPDKAAGKTTPPSRSAARATPNRTGRRSKGQG